MTHENLVRANLLEDKISKVLFDISNIEKINFDLEDINLQVYLFNTKTGSRNSFEIQLPANIKKQIFNEILEHFINEHLELKTEYNSL